MFVLPLVSLPLRSFTRLEADRGQHGPVQYGLTGDYYLDLFRNPSETIFYVPPFAAIGNSLLYATVTVVLSLLLGFPAASALARPDAAGAGADPFFLLPLGASAVTLGLGFIITFNRPPLLLVTSPVLVPLAHTLVALPFVIRILQPALASIPDRLRQAAASLGAPAFRVWLAVDWPIVRRATLSAAVFAFTISLGEFGASLPGRPPGVSHPADRHRPFPFPARGIELRPGHGHGDDLDGGVRGGDCPDRALRLPGAGEF